MVLMLKRLIVVFVLFLMLPLVVLADQAWYLTQAEAQKAVALLKNQKQIKHFCAPCGDKAVETENIEDLTLSPVGSFDDWEVKINGKGIDLAYVYFQTKNGKWKNLARELNIDVESVPTYLPKEKRKK
jgi:hypothetical protein